MSNLLLSGYFLYLFLNVVYPHLVYRYPSIYSYFVAEGTIALFWCQRCCTRVCVSESFPSITDYYGFWP